MHIAIDAREFTPKGKTGISRYLENLIKPLLAYSGLKFTLFLEPDGVVPKVLEQSPINFIRLPNIPTQLNDQFAIPYLVKKHNADIFFSPYYKTCFYGNFKRIITVHDVMFLYNQAIPPLKMWFIKKQLSLAARKADVILVDSNYTAEDLKKFVSGISDKIICLYPDLGEEWFNQLPEHKLETVLKKHSLKRPFFLYTGNFRPHKKVDELIAGFALAIKEQYTTNYHLVLAGGDDLNEPRIQEKIYNLQLTERVHILRKINDEELRAIYQAASWCITASSYEGFGYIVPEAFASGTPVICRDTTSLGEIAGGCMIPLSDSTPSAIKNAILTGMTASESLRAELILNGKKRAELFAPGRAATLFMDVISKLK